MLTYPGNIHIHSRYSDGSGDLEEIAQAAAAAGLSYVIVTDHETLAGLPEESIRHGVLLLVGVEINRTYNHYLGFDLAEMVEADEDDPQRVIDQVREAGGFGYIAHPFEIASPYIEKGKSYPWIHWPVFGFHGLEIWNYTSHWRGLHPSLFKTLYWFFINRKGAMSGPPREALSLWDCYNRCGHRIFALGGSDAHAYLYRLGLLKTVIFPYRYLFGTINNYIVLDDALSGSFDRARQQVLQALRKGRSYICFDSLGSGHNFHFYAMRGRTRVLMGGEIELNGECSLHIRCPGKRSLLRLFWNGKPVLQKKGTDLDYYPLAAGFYRVEVYYRPLLGRPRPWIYSNPIFVKLPPKG